MVADTDSGSQARWEAFLDALIADRELLTKRVRENIRAQLPAYRLVGDRELDWGFRIDLDGTLISARAGHEAVTDEHLAGLIPVGETRARQGIPIQEVLLAWRIGVQVVIDRATEIGPQLEISPDEMLRFVRALIAASDRAMAIIASAHRGAELELAAREHERRAAVVHEALLGKLSPVVVRAHAESCGIDPACDYVAIRAEASPEERAQRERRLGFQSAVTPRQGLGAIIDDDLAGFLLRPPSGQIPFAVGVGPPRPVERLQESFELASRALVTMRAFGLVGAMDLDALGVLPAIVCRPRGRGRAGPPLPGAAGELPGRDRSQPARPVRVRHAHRTGRRAAVRTPEHAPLPGRPLRGDHRRQPAQRQECSRSLVGTPARRAPPAPNRLMPSSRSTRARTDGL